MNRVKSIGVWGLSILLAALFIYAGITKLSSSPGWVTRFNGWGYPDHFYLLVGVIELIGAAALLIPALAGFGALALIVMMIGATITHLVHGEPQAVVTLILIVLLTSIAYLRRSNFAHLIRSRRIATTHN